MTNLDEQQPRPLKKDEKHYFNSPNFRHISQFQLFDQPALAEHLRGSSLYRPTDSQKTLLYHCTPVIVTDKLETTG